jgi:CubicO group peptidase (beta-lactamase class C family)
MIEVRGTVAPGFDSVREEFAAFLSEQDADPGSQLAVHRDGRLVVDLWGGDDIGGDSLTGVFSVTKGATHLIVALLAQEGVLALDRPVGSLPFGLTLRELLGHRSGLIGVDGGFSLAEIADDRVIAARLRAQRPYWDPGLGYGYHALVIGALISAELQRVTGHTVQETFRARLAGADLFLGLPAEQEARYRPVLPALEAAPPVDPDSLMGVAFNVRVDLADLANDRRGRALGQSSAGAVGNARGVARLYASALSLLNPVVAAEFATPYSLGADLVTGELDHFALGFETVARTYSFLHEGAFGHSGATGSLGWADPESGVAYGYVRRRFGFPGPENDRLGAAVMRAVAGA